GVVRSARLTRGSLGSDGCVAIGSRMRIGRPCHPGVRRAPSVPLGFVDVGTDSGGRAMRRRDFISRLAKAGTGAAIVAPSLSGLAAWNFATPAEAHAAARRRAGPRALGYG